MKKIKLKNNKKTKSKVNIIVCLIIIICILSICLLNYIGKKINKKLMQISKIEITNITKKIIHESINNVIANDFNTNDLFLVYKDSNEKIKYIDINSNYVNKLLDLVNKNVSDSINEFNEGKKIKKNIITNTNLITKRNGTIFEIPFGFIFSNSIFSNIGPKIPVKVTTIGDLESEITTKLENYGINTALLEVKINIIVTERIILPLTTKDFEITSTIPISSKIIQGEIPNYYIGTSDLKVVS